MDRRPNAAAAELELRSEDEASILRFAQRRCKDCALIRARNNEDTGAPAALENFLVIMRRFALRRCRARRAACSGLRRVDRPHYNRTCQWRSGASRANGNAVRFAFQAGQCRGCPRNCKRRAALHVIHWDP